MSNYCLDPVACFENNCPGCKNGELWCADPRCSPYCQGCTMPENHDMVAGIIIIVVTLVLFVMLVILWLVKGLELVSTAYK